jgi:hypothetical protein
MKEENENELTQLLKELVSRIKAIEETVYDTDNVLMKSGFVKVDSPTPTMQIASSAALPDSNSIAKMSWDEINDLVENMGGQ